TRESPAGAITGGGAVGACAGGLAALAACCSRTGGGAVGACAGGLAVLAACCPRTGGGAVGACAGGLAVLAACSSRSRSRSACSSASKKRLMIPTTVLPSEQRRLPRQRVPRARRGAPT